MKILSRYCKGPELSRRVIRAEISDAKLWLYSRSGKLIGIVDRNKVSDIWCVNIDVEIYPVFSNWEVLFITRGKAVWDIEILRCVFSDSAKSSVNEFLSSLGGKTLPGLYPVGDHDRYISNWHEIYLLWEKEPLDNRTIRRRIDWFEIEKNRLYVAIVFFLLPTFLIFFWSSATWLWIVFAMTLCYLVIKIPVMMQSDADMKRIGIVPRWFGKTVNPSKSPSWGTEAGK